MDGAAVMAPGLNSNALDFYSQKVPEENSSKFSYLASMVSKLQCTHVCLSETTHFNMEVSGDWGGLGAASSGQ